MNNMLAGIVVLVIIVGMMFASRQFRMLRLKKWSEIAQQAMAEKRFADAEKALRRCLRLMPLWTPARIGLGWALAEQQHLEEAEEQLRMSAELHPKEAGGYLNMALFLVAFQPDRRDEALDMLEKGMAFLESEASPILQDPRWAPLHVDPRFRALLENAPDGNG